MKMPNKKTRLILGVGINDLKGESITAQYRTWASMLSRCYCDNGQGYRTYKGCSVCPEWLVFSNFKAWMDKQDWQGKQLDKDILVQGNKVYSPDTCVFVPRAINAFFKLGINGRDLPTGAAKIGTREAYQCSVSNPFTKKQDLVGVFPTPHEAHQAWRARKHVFAGKLASTETNPRIAKALLERYAPASSDSIQA